MGRTESSRKSREVYILGGIDDSVRTDFIPALRALDRTAGTIDILLSSSGGDEGVGWALYDTIRLCRNKTIIHAYGECKSMAAVILQAGNVRKMSPECRFMIHDGSVSFSADTGRLSSEVHEVELMLEKYYQGLSERSTLTKMKIRGMCKRETTLSAQECLEAGFIDEILQKEINE